MKHDYDKEHYCPVYDKVISSELCYDSMMCLAGFFKVLSLKELEKIDDIKNAKIVCDKCTYSEI